MTPSETYWSQLNWKSKRLVLLWLYILKTEPINEITGSFLEPKWIDMDANIKTHLIPDYVFMMNAAQLGREIDKTGEFPKWIQ